MPWIAALAAIAVTLALDPYLMAQLPNIPQPLTAFAHNITWIGKTDWQAIVLLTVALAGALYRPNPGLAAQAERAMRLAIACFAVILLTGLAVQALKYVFGRPRPAVLGELPVLTFAPLSFQRGGNAFPSGHATTMAALAIFWSAVFPRMAPLLWAVAIAVAISRVLVGAHYPADVVAGLTLGAALTLYMTHRWQAAGLLEAPQPPPPGGLIAIPRTFGRFITALR